MVQAAQTLRVIDADAHLTERHDLFTTRAPKGYEDRVPHVEVVDGAPMWVIEGKTFGKAGSGGTIDPAGVKFPYSESQGGSWGIEDVHPAAWDPDERIRLMDHLGIDAQVLYPNSIGLGGQNLANSITDRSVIQLCIELYNDAMAEIQEASGDRLLPMAIMPAWSISDCVAEAERCAAMGSRGVNMTADPQDLGSPDLGDRRWDPFWEACESLRLPIHFHIGSSQTAFSYWGTTFWPSQDDSIKPAIGGASLFQNNSRVLLNSAYSGMFDRYPALKMVSVESGIGWVPFMLEAMDHELEENAPEYFASLEKAPSQYFRDNWYATLWFETGLGELASLVRTVGADNILFETDYPHPTCLHPNPVEIAHERFSSLQDDDLAKIMGANAASLYRI
jgi:predicted TIM-barrel fold metal-dependent hydrolase